MMASDLKAMFWKECRENARWAVLGLLGLTLGLVYGWYHLFQQASPSGGQVWLTPGPIWSAENLVLTITTPLIGLALGLLQILPELRRDQWAFLIHRPASRTTLFWGKTLPGVCLYLAVTVLPLLGLAIYAASPRHVPAPFDFRFTLGGWAAILAGLPFYFAGLLVALRPARWYGSRALPLLGALLVIWVADNLNEFWQVALLCLLLAAWGSFVTGGEYGEQTKPARFALGLALYPAMLAVGLGILMGVFAILNGLGGRHGGWSRMDDKIDAQGHLFHYSEQGTDEAHMERKTVTVTDADGHSVNPRVWDNLNQQHKLLEFAYLPVKDRSREFYRYSNPARYVMDLASNISDSNQTYWYYQAAAHQIVGYSVSAGIPAPPLYLGPNGSARDRERAGHFPDARPEPTAFVGLHLLRFPQALYWYDTMAPTVGLLQATPGGNSGMTLLSPIESGGDLAQALVVTAGNQLLVYTRRLSGPPPAVAKLFTVSIAMPLDPKTDADIEIAMTPDRSRFFIWYVRWSGPVPGRLITIASNGRILKTETLPVANTTPPHPSFVQASPAVIVPPALLAAITLYAKIGHALGWPSADGFWNTLAGVGPIAFFSVLGGLFAAILALLISRRLGDRQYGQLAWAFGVFWLGGYGVLLLLALRAWPARVPCPTCGRMRVVDRETCEHCGGAFAQPQRDGTEIFEGARGSERLPRLTPIKP